MEGEQQSDGGLETVRVLHQTVISLRSALEQSKNEIIELREKVKSSVDPEPFNRTIQSLSIENHVLRQRVLSGQPLNMDKESDSSDVDDVFEEEEEKPELNGLEKTIETVETPRVSKGDSEESEEVDDIELIFTTDDKELTTLQEDLVSIADTDSWKKRTDEDIPANLKHTWSHSVLVETDISKCGIIDENEPPTQHARRNTLPTPLPYRPILHREVIGESRTHLCDKPAVKFSVERSPRSVRPILAEKNSMKQENEAQTDITALPVQWRSESYLAHHKVSPIFTTLPSKFALPFGQLRKQSLRLSEKTQEARRVLLSDINFTSMVPELSRSADHLCPQETSSLLSKYPRAMAYMKNPEISSGSKSGWSPCECRRPSWDYCYSSASIAPSDLDVSSRRRHSMRPSLSAFDTSWSLHQNHLWASVPSSPTHAHRSRSVPLSCSYHRTVSGSDATVYPKSRTRPGHRQRVKFADSRLSRGYRGRSLPDLRIDSATEDSTDSLIDESETYLRRSIDSIVTGDDPIFWRRQRRIRSQSQPDRISTNGFEPPRTAQPYLVRRPSDLKSDHWVKVITADGKLTVGRVAYVGPLHPQNDVYVGVILQPGDAGNTNGTHQGTTYFDCDAGCGLFVPFKKVVMAWSL